MSKQNQDDLNGSQDSGPIQHPSAIPGTVLAGRFQIQGAAGSPGTTAYALRAKDLVTEEDVVCKIPRPELNDGRTLLLTQYRRMRAMWIPTLACPVGFFEHTDADGILPILVLEWIAGPTLDEWAAGATTASARVSVLEQVAAALAALHGQKMRHGDVDVGNVKVREGRVVLIDPEADIYGTTRSDAGNVAPGPSVPRDDLLGLVSLIERFLPKECGRSLEGILARSRGEVRRPTASEIAFVLRGASEVLRSTEGARSETLGDRLRTAEARHSSNFEMIATARSAQLTLLAERLSAMVSREKMPATTTASLNIDAEESPAWPSSASFPMFHLGCSISEHDRFDVYVEPVGPFPKPLPYPDSATHVGRGTWSVRRDGVTAIEDAVVLVYDSGAVRFLNRQRNWPLDEVVLDNDWLHRSLAILAGTITPGLLAPGSFGPESENDRSSSYPWYRLGDREGIYEVAGAPPVIVDMEWFEAAARFALHQSAFGQTDEPDALRMLWDGPRQRRVTVVQMVARGFARRFGALLDAFTRFDVIHVDELSRHVEVEIELAPLWEKTRRIRFDLQAGMLPPKSPVWSNNSRRSLISWLKWNMRRKK